MIDYRQEAVNIEALITRAALPPTLAYKQWWVYVVESVHR
jgi:hypothetical protein